MSEIPDALVEKAARAVFSVGPEHDDTETWDEKIARAVLAAILPDLAEDRRRAIESALTFAAAHDDLPAARPVVDADWGPGCMEHRTRRPCTCEGDPDDPAMADPYCLRHSTGRSEYVQDAADVRRAMAEQIAADLDECGYYPAATRIRYRLAHGTNGNLGPAAPTARTAGGTP